MSRTGGAPTAPRLRAEELWPARGLWRRARADPADNPFPGARPFRADEHELFHGRDRESGELAALVSAKQLVLLHAPSGAGKSSMINASLLRRLAAGSDRDEVPKPGTFAVLGIASVHPGGVRRADGWPPRDEVPNVYVAAALDSLAAAGRSRHGTLAGFLDAQPVRTDLFGDPLPRLLVVDQFEEILHPFPRKDWLDCRRVFAEQLGEALRGDVPLHVLLSIRDEHLADIERLLAIVPERFQSRFRLDLLAPPRARDAIVEPARHAGLPVTPELADRLVDELSQRRLHELDTSVPIGSVDPGQLSVVCHLLWAEAAERGSAQITLDHLTTVGGVGGALRRYYVDTLRSTAGRRWHRRVHRFFTDALISDRGTRLLAPFDPEDRWTARVPTMVFEDLARHGLVRVERRGDASYLELSHDALVEPVRTAYESPRRGLLAVVAFLVVALAVAVGFALDRDAVDASGAATSMPPGADDTVHEVPPGESVKLSGGLDGPDEVEVFYVSVPDGLGFDIETRASSGPPADVGLTLTVRGPDEAIVALEGVSMTESATARVAGTQEGPHQILVAAADEATGAPEQFTLVVTADPAAPGSVRPDSVSAVVDLSLGGSREHTFAAEDAADGAGQRVHHVRAPGGVLLRTELTQPVGTSFLVSIIGPAGSALATELVRGEEESTTPEVATVGGGLFEIHLAPFDDDSDVDEVDVAVRLVVDDVLAEAPAPAPPGSTPLELGEGDVEEITGRLDAPDQVDVVELELGAGAQVEVVTATETGIGPDTVLTIWRPDGELYNVDDDGGPGLGSLLRIEDAESGIYHLLVSAFPGSGDTGPYVLCIRSLDADGPGPGTACDGLVPPPASP